MPLQERIEIPESAKLPKPWFPDLPGDDIVKEIREFVSETGKPYLWRGHTHTRPEVGTHVQYVEEFSLPRRCKTIKSWSPCPCCLPDFPKYKYGKIAWFPDEKLIRLIGPDCYAKLDADGHQTASDELRRRQAERRYTEYLLSLTPLIDDIKASLRVAFSIAAAADEFFPGLRYRIEDVLQVRLWSAVRTGELQITETLIEHVRDSDGKEQERRISTNRRYATIKGIEAINPARRPKAERAQRLLDKFDDARLAPPFNPAEFDHTTRRELANKIGRTVRDAERLFEELRLELQFLKPENFQTLRTWARLPNAPVHLFLERETDAVVIGRREPPTCRVPFSSELVQRLPPLPKLAKVKIG